MNRNICWLAAAFVLVPLCAWTPAAEQDKVPAAMDDVQDFVFLGEARPVLVRLHVRLDGKPVHANWDDFMKHLFTRLDLNADGVLSKEEAERAPTVDQIVSGMPNSGFGGFGGMGGAPAQPTMRELDADNDGKVTLAELSAYYRQQGFAPFQYQFDSKQPNPFAQFLGGGGKEPSMAAVSEAIFALLDTDKDGKLTKEELAAAPDVLLRLDENDDEMIVPRELAAPVAPAPGMMAGGGMMGGGGLKGPGAADGNDQLVLVETPGKVPAKLVQHLQKRYGPAAGQPGEKKLNRKDLGLDEATFAKLDTNGDVQRPPDVELTIRLGAKKASEVRVDLAGKAGPLAGKFKLLPSVALLDLGATRVELRGSEAERTDRLGGLLRQQYVAQFKQADKDGNGYLDEKEAQASPLFRGLFHVLDRDGDGKVTEKELIAYLDDLRDLQQRGRAGCVTLVLSDQSRGLFDLLDLNRDGRLSVREMRGAVKLLEQLGAAKKGHVTRQDMPHSYLMAVRKGGASRGAVDITAALEDLYGGTYDTSEADYPAAGPLWFRKMDRNRDGDVSRKEFLGSDEQFRLIDTDGDGLISVEEAERYDVLHRKK
jgi:Ca2+-binding EF-hand superfamily protein